MGLLPVDKKKELVIILKTVERCNIDCTYCYFFYSKDRSYLKHPPYIGLNTVKEIAEWIYKGCCELNIGKVSIGFHGGEPMMQNKEEFSAMCDCFIESITRVAKLRFNLQTNGTLVTDEWLKVLDKYKVSVGVSLDGTKEYNDIARLDKRGRSTYDRVIKGIEALRETKLAKKNGGISLLCVINPELDAKKIYKHFVHDLKAVFCDFILPDSTHDDKNKSNAIKIGKFLCDLFDEWVKDGRKTDIRFLNGALSSLNGSHSGIYGIGKNNMGNQFPLITIASNGDLFPVDELRVCFDLDSVNANIQGFSMKEFFSLSIFDEIQKAQNVYPDDCQNCCWKKACNAGTLVSRFSEDKRFNNSSIYCEGLMEFYSHAAAYMLKNGYSETRMLKNLEIALS